MVSPNPVIQSSDLLREMDCTAAAVESLTLTAETNSHGFMHAVHLMHVRGRQVGGMRAWERLKL